MEQPIFSSQKTETSGPLDNIYIYIPATDFALGQFSDDLHIRASCAVSSLNSDI